jgi:hypothetical protein
MLARGCLDTRGASLFLRTLFPAPARFTCPRGPVGPRCLPRCPTAREDRLPAWRRPAAAVGDYGNKWVIFNICNIRSTFIIFRWNTCSIRPKQLKTLAKYVWNTCKTSEKLENTCVAMTNIAISRWKHLQHTYATTWNTCICMQHPDETLAYTCNIQMKHLQYTSKTDKTFRTYTWNILV